MSGRRQLGFLVSEPSPPVCRVSVAWLVGLQHSFLESRHRPDALNFWVKARFPPQGERSDRTTRLRSGPRATGGRRTAFFYRLNAIVLPIGP